jgi:hypothetical protein
MTLSSTGSPKLFKLIFFASSSSSIHLAPRSLPNSPTRRQSTQITSELERQTEARVMVLGPDPLAPVHQYHCRDSHQEKCRLKDGGVSELVLCGSLEAGEAAGVSSDGE